MPIVTQYRASKMYPISRNALSRNSKRVPLPEYFVKLKDSPPMVDTDHPMWKYYIKSIARSKGVDVDHEVKFRRLLQCVVEAVKETYDPTDEELQELTQLISDKFGG